MAALPYMPLFVADYLADTAHMTAVQHGAYLLLIMNYWQRGGPLPNDDAKLARIARMSKRDWTHNKDEVLEFFYVQDNLLYHNRIADELARVEAKSLKCKDAAQASVQRRFGKRSASVEPTDTQAHTVSEPKGSSSAGVVLEERRRAVGSCLRKAFPPPDRVTDEQWAAFQQQRKKKLNDRSYALITAKLNELAESGWPPGEMIDLATERGWETVFEPRTQKDDRRTDRMARHQPDDGLSPTTRAAVAVFGPPSARQQ